MKDNPSRTAFRHTIILLLLLGIILSCYAYDVTAAVTTAITTLHDYRHHAVANVPRHNICTIRIFIMTTSDIYYDLYDIIIISFLFFF